MEHSVKKILRRVLLAVGGADGARIKKAALSAADAVFCDLEDGVAVAQKAAARGVVVRAMRELTWGTKGRLVRINGLDTLHWQEDLEAVLRGAGDVLDGFIVPKVNRAADVLRVEKELKKLEKKFGVKKPVAMECLIESAEGVEQAAEIAVASPRVVSLIFGAADFAASLGMKPTLKHFGDLFSYPRFKLVAAARAAGIAVLDSPFFDFKDDAGFAKACSHAAAMGFDGKMIIHPAQIKTGLKVFTPTKKEIAFARKVVTAYQKAMAEGTGVIAVEGEMIDVATAKLYQNILDKAEAFSL